MIDRIAGMLLLLASMQPGQLDSAIEMSDQFGDIHRLPPCKDCAFVLVYSDQEGSSRTRQWLEVISNSGCRLVEAANLEKAPALARPFIRRAFRNSSSVLMDWRGELAETLGFEADSANIYLFDSQGSLQAHRHGHAGPDDLVELNELMETYCHVAD